MGLEYIEKDLKKNRIVSVVFPVKDYNNQIMQLTKVLDGNFTKILYVSLNKLYIPLRIKMLENSIEPKKFLFIDAATKTAIAHPDPHENCTYVSSPNSLTEISVAISRIIQKSYPEIILFDSLSTLLIYEKDIITSQFLHSLTNKINAYGINIIYTILNGEKEQALITDLNMLSDKVINIKAINE